MNCWFCSVREAAAEHVWSTEMYGDVDTKKTDEQTQVVYNVRHIEVPRCADCHSRHSLALAALVAGFVFLAILAAAVIVAAFTDLPQWIWGLGAGLALGLILGMLAVRFVSLKGIYSIREARREYPQIKESLANCYRFGFRPKGHLPKGDGDCQDEPEQKET